MSTANTALPWSLQHIDFDRIIPERVRDDETLFFVLCSASFVESGSDVYTRNLVSYYHDDPDLSRWLNEHWEPEELQHGRALRAYVERIWPEFDWSSAFHHFFEEYSKRCTVAEFEATQALELAARCVVEMGTATLYRSLARYASEPILHEIAEHIRSDEIRHYKYFYQYFLQYNQREGNNRLIVLGALVRRLLEIRNDDSECAVRHVMAFRDPSRAHDKQCLQDINAQTRHLIRRNVSADMSVKMFIKPLNLSPGLSTAMQYPLRKVVQYAFLR